MMEEEIISKGTLPPDVTAVEPLEDWKLHLTFENGEERIFDMKPYRYGVFARLDDPEYFMRVRVRWGAITWPHDQDLSPGMLYKNSKSLAVQ
jgi:hypothetical protein